jgi:hypothetical protein
MRKFSKLIFLVVVINFCAAFDSNAQEIGIRFGGINGYLGPAIDGVFSAGPFERIHADLGFFQGGVGIDALWDFVHNPINGEAINWYLGVGPSTYFGKDLYFGVSGEIGLEYRFEKVPIAFGLDWRPTFWLIEETKFGSGSFGVNFRFVFGK